MFDKIKSGSFARKVIATAIITSTSISIGTLSNQQIANAGEIKDIIDIVAQYGGNVYGAINAGKIRQYWYASFDGNAIQRQYGTGGAANGVLNQWCSENYSNRMKLSGADYASFWWGGGRWIIVQSRFEGGSGNCYMRRVAR